MNHTAFVVSDSIASSLASVEIPLPSGADDEQRSTSSQNSIKSLNELLEEAKQINSPEDRKAFRQKKASKMTEKDTRALRGTCICYHHS